MRIKNYMCTALILDLNLYQIRNFARIAKKPVSPCQKTMIFLKDNANVTH